MAQMKISNNGLAFTAAHEGCRLTAYRDPGGVWTVGVGHTGPDVHEGLTITQQQAESFLAQDMQTAVDAVNRLVTVPLNQNQFDALCDFVYNVGGGNFASSTLLKFLNLGNYYAAAKEFDRWVFAIFSNGVAMAREVVPGLVNRRNDEKALFLS
jgi:lysozyme